MTPGVMDVAGSQLLHLYWKLKEIQHIEIEKEKKKKKKKEKKEKKDKEKATSSSHEGWRSNQGWLPFAAYHCQ